MAFQFPYTILKSGMIPVKRFKLILHKKIGPGSLGLPIKPFAMVRRSPGGFAEGGFDHYHQGSSGEKFHVVTFCKFRLVARKS